VINCSYTQEAQPNLSKKIESAAVTLRLPKNDNGKSFNQYEFAGGKPKGVEDISGYGEKAFWDPALGILNVLKNDKWVLISNGSSAADRKLEDAKKLADIVVPKL
jgi:hypothetical protein